MLNYLLYRANRRNCFTIKPEGLGQDALLSEGKIQLSKDRGPPFALRASEGRQRAEDRRQKTEVRRPPFARGLRRAGRGRTTYNWWRNS